MLIEQEIAVYSYIIKRTIIPYDDFGFTTKFEFEYKKIKFDGSKPQQNFYISIDLFDKRGICTTDMLIGDWELIFRGTNVPSLEFKVLDQIIPGMEDNYKPVC